IWGDTVNVASRMESSGVPSRIHVSESTMALTKRFIAYTEPVVMEIKGKGIMKTYFLR
ncbi:MAG: adenylate/guanylate cyclase domain-containing protein, partial [Treponema sp.]|nr:adenylate/guanylate cyclase domain-containing protein [Treponema sp.]